MRLYVSPLSRFPPCSSLFCDCSVTDILHLHDNSFAPIAHNPSVLRPASSDCFWLRPLSERLKIWFHHRSAKSPASFCFVLRQLLRHPLNTVAAPAAPAPAPAGLAPAVTVLVTAKPSASELALLPAPRLESRCLSIITTWCRPNPKSLWSAAPNPP